MSDVKKELQRIFEFVVKYHGGVASWPNGNIRKFLRWAWYYRKLFVLYDDVPGGARRIAGVAVAWRTETPNADNNDFSPETTEYGDYLHAFRVVVHPEYRRQHVLFGLLSLALTRFPGVEKVWWDQDIGPKTKLRIMELSKLLRLLANEQKVA